MKHQTIAPLVAFLVLSACANQIGGPVGAPTPTHPDMTFVDGQGCSWWVIGNAASYSWAKQTNARGEHVCSESEPAPADPNPGVPFVSENNPDLPVVASKPEPDAGQIFVQVATFAFANNANKTASRMTDLGLPVRKSSLSIGNDGFYRLVLGPFADRPTAQNALEIAKTEGFADAFLYRR